MADYRKRSTKRRRRNEANLVGDLFRVLFAVSMLIVAIMAAFFVVQHVSGFSLPELRQTPESAAESETPQVLTAAAETKAKETAASTTAESSTETEAESETEEEEEESTKAESTEASTAKEEKESKEPAKESASISDEGPAKQKETKATAADRDYEEKDYTTEEKPIRGGAVVGEAPTAGGDSSSVSGPGADVQIGQGPVS